MKVLDAKVAAQVNEVKGIQERAEISIRDDLRQVKSHLTDIQTLQESITEQSRSQWQHDLMQATQRIYDRNQTHLEMLMQKLEEERKEREEMQRASRAGMLITFIRMIVASFIRGIFGGLGFLTTLWFAIPRVFDQRILDKLKESTSPARPREAAMPSIRANEATDTNESKSDSEDRLLLLNAANSLSTSTQESSTSRADEGQGNRNFQHAENSVPQNTRVESESQGRPGLEIVKPYQKNAERGPDIRENTQVSEQDQRPINTLDASTTDSDSAAGLSSMPASNGAPLIFENRLTAKKPAQITESLVPKPSTLERTSTSLHAVSYKEEKESLKQRATQTLRTLNAPWSRNRKVKDLSYPTCFTDDALEQKQKPEIEVHREETYSTTHGERDRSPRAPWYRNRESKALSYPTCLPEDPAEKYQISDTGTHRQKIYSYAPRLLVARKKSDHSPASTMHSFATTATNPKNRPAKSQIFSTHAFKTTSPEPKKRATKSRTYSTSSVTIAEPSLESYRGRHSTTIKSWSRNIPPTAYPVCPAEVPKSEQEYCRYPSAKAVSSKNTTSSERTFENKVQEATSKDNVKEAPTTPWSANSAFGLPGPKKSIKTRNTSPEPSTSSQTALAYLDTRIPQVQMPTPLGLGWSWLCCECSLMRATCVRVRGGCDMCMICGHLRCGGCSGVQG